MTKRLQVLIEEPVYREIQRMARANHITIAEWVRRALAAARRREPASDMSKKLSAVRAAAQYGFPSGNVAEMLAEIERGYTGDRSS